MRDTLQYGPNPDSSPSSIWSPRFYSEYHHIFSYCIFGICSEYSAADGPTSSSHSVSSEDGIDANSAFSIHFHFSWIRVLNFLHLPIYLRISSCFPGAHVTAAAFSYCSGFAAVVGWVRFLRRIRPYLLGSATWNVFEFVTEFYLFWGFDSCPADMAKDISHFPLWVLRITMIPSDQALFHFRFLKFFICQEIYFPPIFRLIESDRVPPPATTLKISRDFWFLACRLFRRCWLMKPLYRFLQVLFWQKMGIFRHPEEQNSKASKSVAWDWSISSTALPQYLKPRPDQITPFWPGRPAGCSAIFHLGKWNRRLRYLIFHLCPEFVNFPSSLIFAWTDSSQNLRKYYFLQRYFDGLVFAPKCRFHHDFL